jgi:hypothetical protein
MRLKIKKIIVLCLAGMISALSALAQNEKKDSIMRRHHCGTSLNMDPPLMIMNGIDVKSIRGGFDDINPEDIVDIKILRGQEAIDKYGEQGKNGVVLFKMKKEIKNDLISSTEILKKFEKRSCKNHRLIFKPTQGKEEEYDHEHVVNFVKSKITLKEDSANGDCIVIVEQKKQSHEFLPNKLKK